MTKDEIVCILKERYDTSFWWCEGHGEGIIIYGHHLDRNAIEEEFGLTFEGIGNQCFVFSFGE